ncbi:MAG: hypothetical protein U1E29_14455 [Coriobacteriia bacterium]|nr:hypothetical protein [Coriobacteriia bacterium]
MKRYRAMKRSTQGWTHDVVVGLLCGFGFESKQGSEHTICFDPEDKANAVQIPRHRAVKGYVVELTTSAIEQKLKREGLNADGK